MTDSDFDRYLQLKDEFKKVSKRILKKLLSTNPVKITEYREDLIRTHNEIIKYVAGIYSKKQGTKRYIQK